jgi:hypothetical protein
MLAVSQDSHVLGLGLIIMQNGSLIQILLPISMVGQHGLLGSGTNGLDGLESNGAQKILGVVLQINTKKTQDSQCLKWLQDIQICLRFHSLPALILGLEGPIRGKQEALGPTRSRQLMGLHSLMQKESLESLRKCKSLMGLHSMMLGQRIHVASLDGLCPGCLV